MSTADCAPPQSGSRQLCLLLLGRSERQHSPLRSLPKAPLWQHAARCKGVERKRWESIRLGILRLSGFVNSANVARVPGAISARELGVRQTIHPETVILRATPSSRHLGCVSCVWPVHPSLATLLLSANMTTILLRIGWLSPPPIFRKSGSLGRRRNNFHPLPLAVSH